MPQYAVLFVAYTPPYVPKSAAGVGRAFAKVETRELFMRTIELYANRDHIAQRMLCVHTDDLQTVQSKYAAHLGFQGVDVSAGGPDWFGIVARGLEKLNPSIDAVLVHDASRPAVTYHLLDALEKAYEAVEEGRGAVAPVLAVSGHLAKVLDNTLDASVDSPALHEIQSPQLFSRALLSAALAKRGAGGEKVPDEAALIRLASGKVTTIPGSAYNIRMSTDEQLKLAADYLKHLPKPRKMGPITPFDEAQW